MYISDADHLENSSIGTQAESPAVFNKTSDINFFNAHLNLTAQPSRKIGPAMPSTLFNLGASESTARRVKRGMRDRLRNKQTKEAHALPESLAVANFEVVSQVKVLGMLVKGLDKVSNMV